MWFARQLDRLLAKYTAFVLVPVMLVVWLVSLARGSDVGDLLYKVLLGVAAGTALLLAFGGFGAEGREWEGNVAGHLPGAYDRMRQVRVDMHASFATSTKLADPQRVHGADRGACVYARPLRRTPQF
ncbi:MAG: hypothetical protein HY334_05225 [Armatimonadetes bacterium]|nr:hypothetical protein [Armatimonadota bacterium]